jgi:7tm Chemosensory receptor
MQVLNHKKHKTCVKMSMLLVIFTVFLSSFSPPVVFFFYGSTLNPLRLTCWFTLHFIRTVFVLQFCLACACVRKRFEALNNHIKLTTKTRKIDFFSRKLDLMFGNVYNDLCKAIVAINETFATPLILIFSNILLKSIFAAYAIIDQLRGDQLSRFAFAVIQGLLLVNLLCLVVFTSCEGSRLTNAAQHTRVLVSELMNECEFTREQKSELVYLTSQMRMKKLNVETFLFTINWNVFLTVNL